MKKLIFTRYFMLKRLNRNLFILLAIIGLLASCGGKNDCICKLQQNHETVYSIDNFNYIVIDSNTTYHFIAASRWCGDDEYTIIKIK